MRALSILPLLMLAGCTTFTLGMVQKQDGKTPDEQAVATIICKDQAFQAAATTARQIGNAVAIATLVGAPIAAASDRAYQREVFTACMKERGYVVNPPQGW